MLDLAKILAELKQERDQLAEAIGNLERMPGKSRRGSKPPGRGGPPPQSNLPPCAGDTAAVTTRAPSEPEHNL